jgi:hypothetical protein
MEKNIPRKKKKFVPTAFKIMLAAGSLAGTVGVWNILARQELTQANAQDLNLSGTFVSTDPLPTVASLLVITPSMGSNQSSTPTVAAIRDVTVNTASQPAAPMNGSTISLPPSSAPAMITNTQTSKKP